MTNQLPPHLERWFRPGATVNLAQLRTILEAAVAIAEADPALRHVVDGDVFEDCSFCNWDRCDPDCPHHQLRAALRGATSRCD